MMFTCSECDSKFNILDDTIIVQCDECKSTHKKTGKTTFSYIPPVRAQAHIARALKGDKRYKRLYRYRIEKTEQQKQHDLFCLHCKCGISHIDSTPVEIQTGMGKREVGKDILDGVEVPKFIYFPATRKGRVCKSCLRDHISLSEIIPEHFPVAVIEERADHSTIGFGHGDDPLGDQKPVDPRYLLGGKR